MRETQVRSQGQEDPLEEGMATHSSILVWRLPWTEEPGGLQSTGSQRTQLRDWHFHSSSAGLLPLEGPAPTYLLALSVIPLLQPSGESKRAGWVSCLAGASLPLSHQGSRWLTSVVGVVGAYGRFSLCVSSVDLLSFSR